MAVFTTPGEVDARVAAAISSQTYTKAQIDSIKNSAFLGGATTSTVPDEGLGSQIWQATQSGTYTNMGGLEVDLAEGVTYLIFDGEDWSKSTTPVDLGGYATREEVSATKPIIKATPFDTTEPVLIKEVITPPVTTRWATDGTYFKKSFSIFYQPTGTRVFNSVSFPVVRNYNSHAGIPTTFSDGILFKMWVSGVMVATIEIPLSRLSVYNTFTGSTPLQDFFLNVDLNVNVVAKSGDLVIVAWEFLEPSDKGSFTYQSGASAGFDWLRKNRYDFDIINAIEPPTEPGSTNSGGFNVPILFLQKYNSNPLTPENQTKLDLSVQDPLYARKLRALNIIDQNTTYLTRINPPLDSVWNSSTTENFAKAWKVFYKGFAEKNFNVFRFPIVRNFSAANGIPQQFTGEIIVKLWLNNYLVIQHTVLLEELAFYNALTSSSALTDFFYEVALKEGIAIAPADVICVGWECAVSTDRCAWLYNNESGDFREEWEDRSLNSSNTEGYVSSPTALPGSIPAPKAWFVPLQFLWKTVDLGDGPAKETLSIMYPPVIYTTINNIITTDLATNGASFLYLDHLLNISSAKRAWFKGNGGDRIVFEGIKSSGSINGGVDVNNSNVNITVAGDGINDSSFVVQKRSIRNTVGKDIGSRLLVIGDSVTKGASAPINSLSSPGTKRAETFYQHVRRYFEQDKIDGGDNEGEYELMLLGTQRDYSNSATFTIDYGGSTVSARTFCEGRAGWKASDYLYKADIRRPVQGAWDLLGLGNGTGTDFTGSNAQRRQLFQAIEGALTPVNTAALVSYMNSEYGSITNYSEALAKAADLLANPINPFFDKDKTGSHRFSFEKYLIRYKTLSSDGSSRLTVGVTAGSEVVSATAYDVCEPTHVILQLGFNDRNVNGLTTSDITNYLTNMQRLADQIQADVPGCVVGFSLPDASGTFFPEFYPEFDHSVSLFNYLHSDVYRMNKELMAIEDAANLQFYIPNFFIQPTAKGYPHRKLSSMAGDIYTATGNDPVIHPGGIAHEAWGYQIYAWMKYTFSL